jgi:hypothetical protein
MICITATILAEYGGRARMVGGFFT